MSRQLERTLKKLPQSGPATIERFGERPKEENKTGKLNKMEKNVSKNKKAVSPDLNTLLQQAQALVAATADVTGEKVAAARKQLSEALEQGKEVYGEVREDALNRAKAVDEFICTKPYAALGIGVGVGLFIGLLLGGRRRD